MSKTTKIATCCYCGSRASVVLGAGDAKDLTCDSCGAPLTDLQYIEKPQKSSKSGRISKPRTKNWDGNDGDHDDDRKGKKKKKKKGFGRWLFEEAKDAIEDIFD